MRDPNPNAPAFCGLTFASGEGPGLPPNESTIFMQVRSLNNSLLAHARTEQQGLVGGLTTRQRLFVLLLNTIPLLHGLAVIETVVFLPSVWWIRCVVAGVVLYLFPPFVVRVLLLLGRIHEGIIPLGSKDFFLWWASFQWQMIFCRFPALEELLRLIPGLYSLWLRLWGSRIGRFTFWAPGTLILDRSFLQIGDDVVLGAGVRLNAHVADIDSEGHRRLLLAKLEIGDRCHIGGYSLLTAGTKIEKDQTTKAFLLSPPFSLWRNGKRVREPSTSEFSVDTPKSTEES
jgi:hypothetical protein